MKVLPDGLGLGVALADALLGVALADGVGEAAVVAGADGVGETAVVAGAALVGVLAATFPACDGSRQPATTTSRVANTALTNVKRHGRRGCGAGMQSSPSIVSVDPTTFSGPATRKGCRPRPADSAFQLSVAAAGGKVADPRGLLSTGGTTDRIRAWW